jgi:hypothetical protein
MAKPTEKKSIPIVWTERSLGTHVGYRLMNDAAVAINELVANAWDAYATRVDIKLPKADVQPFSISDNGSSMTPKEFEERWASMDYNRVERQGRLAEKPPHLSHLPDRVAYGRNGQGRFGAFCFTGENYLVETRKKGVVSLYRVSKTYNATAPIKIDRESSGEPTSETGTRIYGETGIDMGLSADAIRAEIGLRYLHDPSFEVLVDGERVSFADVQDYLSSEPVQVDGVGCLQLIALDAKKADKNSLRHGVSWQVNRRLVGKPDTKFMDGRRTASKRFNFIVQAECLLERIKPDWSGFIACAEVDAAEQAVHNAIEKFLRDNSAETRAEVAKSLRQKNIMQLRSMGPSEKAVWEEFLDKVQTECPTLRHDHLETIAGILAKLEASKSKFSILARLKDCSSDDLDSLNELFEDWDINTAKKVLDEIKWRIELINELENKMLDPKTDELHDLQPIFDKGLWMFGPEFEAPDFTSNRQMRTVIKTFFGEVATEGGSKNRPDFLIVQGSVILVKACPRYEQEVVGTAHVVIVELKAPKVELKTDEVDQCQKYVRELLASSAIQPTTRVTCFLLGTSGSPTVFEPTFIGKGELRSVIPITYGTVLERAKSRMLSLYQKVQQAPFFQKESGKQYIEDQVQGGVFDISRTTYDMSPSATGQVAESSGQN